MFYVIIHKAAEGLDGQLTPSRNDGNCKGVTCALPALRTEGIGKESGMGGNWDCGSLTHRKRPNNSNSLLFLADIPMRGLYFLSRSSQ